MASIQCAHCGTELLGQTGFCPECGQSITAVDQGKTSSQEVAAGAQIVEQAVPLPIPENIAAVIAYMTPIPAVIFLYLEPFRRNIFVRFHAFQHIVLWCFGITFAIVSFLLWMVLQLIPFMRALVFPFAGLIGLAWFFLWLLLVVKAYRHEMFKLPFIGDFVEEWSLS